MGFMAGYKKKMSSKGSPKRMKGRGWGVGGVGDRKKKHIKS